MIKKISLSLISLLMSLIMGLGVVASSAPTITIVDAVNDTLKVTGSATRGSYVSILVPTPGFTYEQAIAGSDGSVQYFNGMRVKNNGYNFEFSLSGAQGGEIVAYVDTDGVVESSGITVYSASYKLDCIRALNSAADDDAIKKSIDNAIKILPLSDNSLYIDGDINEIAKSVLDIRALQNGGVFSEDFSLLGQIAADVEVALILAAFNAGKKELISDNGYIKYSSTLSLESLTDEYIDYTSNLSDNGKSNVLEGMLACKFKSIDDARTRFADLVHINVLLNYKLKGHGHISTYFSKYKNAYEDAGFKIPSSEDKNKFLDFLETQYNSDIKVVASNFNSIPSSNNGSGSGSSGGFSGGGSGVGKAPATSGNTVSDSAVSYLPVESDKDNGEQIIQKPVAGFTDVTDEHWAYECVTELSSMGIISGYPDGGFKPSASITRAEFAQLVKKAFSISGEGTTFGDVANDAWYYDAVTSLASNGIISGFDGKYNPDANITREDATLIIYRCLGANPSGELAFIDSDSFSEYSKEAVATLLSLGIISGYEDGTFKPKGDISRAEAAKIIYSCISKEG